MAPLKLITSGGNKNSFKALIAAEINDIKIEISPFEMGVTNKTPEFLALNPIGKVPVMETPSGPIFESNAIAKYVAKLNDRNLFGSSMYEMALVEQWIDFSTNEIDAHMGRWLYPLLGFFPQIQQVQDAAISSIKRGLGALDTFLSANTFLVGDAVTLADVVTFCNLYLGFRFSLFNDFIAEFPHVHRYFTTLNHQAAFLKIAGNVEKDATTVQAFVKAREEASKKQSVPVKPAEKPVAKPKAAKKAPVKEVDEEDDEPPKPKPTKNALDLLPPSTMNMDEWKRLYSNTKAHNFREVAIAGFWNMFDREGYSLWFCDYKFNEENTVNFVTLNKVSGFLQRMEIVRKYAFAKMCILGKTPPFAIKGFWMFRGQDVPQMVKDECYDAELYEWTKVDLASEEQKELVNQYMEEPDEISGLHLVEAKCFK